MVQIEGGFWERLDLEGEGNFWDITKNSEKRQKPWNDLNGL
jgi:hypothetical protein